MLPFLALTRPLLFPFESLEGGQMVVGLKVLDRSEVSNIADFGGDIRAEYVATA